MGVVYLLVSWLTPWLAGWVQGSLLPVLGWPKSVSAFQFLFSHLFALSFVPAFAIALANVRFKQNVVAFVWLVPTLVLCYKLLTFPTASVFQTFQSHASSAFHHYFGGGFSIPEYRNWQEFWSSMTMANADVGRGMEQMHFTAPFYAGVGYSIAGWIAARIDLRRKICRSRRLGRTGTHTQTFLQHHCPTVRQTGAHSSWKGSGPSLRSR